MHLMEELRKYCKIKRLKIIVYKTNSGAIRRAKEALPPSYSQVTERIFPKVLAYERVLDLIFKYGAEGTRAILRLQITFDFCNFSSLKDSKNKKMIQMASLNWLFFSKIKDSKKSQTRLKCWLGA